jgi:hypothetical protein
LGGEKLRFLAYSTNKNETRRDQNFIFFRTAAHAAVLLRSFIHPAIYSSASPLLVVHTQNFSPHETKAVSF